MKAIPFFYLATKVAQFSQKLIFYVFYATSFNTDFLGGKNLRIIITCQLLSIHKSSRIVVPTVEVLEADSWRPVYLKKLLSSRVEALYKADLEEVARLDGLIESLGTS